MIVNNLCHFSVSNQSFAGENLQYTRDCEWIETIQIKRIVCNAQPQRNFELHQVIYLCMLSETGCGWQGDVLSQFASATGSDSKTSASPCINITT